MGMHSGLFTKLGRVSKMDDCIERCCKSSNADVAFMLGSVCFAVKCYTPELCKTAPAMISNIGNLNMNPTLSFLKKKVATMASGNGRLLFCSVYVSSWYLVLCASYCTLEVTLIFSKLCFCQMRAARERLLWRRNLIRRGGNFRSYTCIPLGISTSSFTQSFEEVKKLASLTSVLARLSLLDLGLGLKWAYTFL